MLQKPRALRRQVIWKAHMCNVMTGIKYKAVLQKVRKRRSLGGSLPGALEAFLALRGIRTLPIRMRQHESNAHAIAHRLQAHNAVLEVRYPGKQRDYSIEDQNTGSYTDHLSVLHGD